jgi:hypothetical protein
VLIGTHPLFNASSIKEIQELLDALNNNSKTSTSSQKPASNPTISQETQTKSLGTLIESLLQNVAKDENLKQTLVSTLKSQTINQNIDETTQSLKNIVQNLKEDPILKKYVPKLEQFLLDIKSIDAKNLRIQMQNSGVFLESKLAAQDVKNSTFPLSIKETLDELQNTLKKLPFPKADTQKLTDTIKSLLANVKNSKNLNDAVLSDIKKVFSSVIKDFKIDKPLLQEFSKIQNALEFHKQIQLSKALQSIKSGLITHTNQAIYNDKISNVQNLVSLLKEPTAVFSQENVQTLHTIVNQVKALPVKNRDLTQNLLKLSLHVNDIALHESKIQNALSTEGLSKVLTQTKELLEAVKSDVLHLQSTQILPQKNADILTKMIDTLLVKLFASQETLKQSNPVLTPSSQETLPKLTQPLVVSKDLTQLLDAFQKELRTFEPKTHFELQIHKNLAHLEQIISKEIQTLNEQMKYNASPVKEKLENDIKAILLHVKEDLSKNPASHTKELALHVQKALSHIEYYQLNSYVMNQTSLYLPFLWDDLKKGEVHFKRLKENRFFCEIDIELKEYGKIDMMLMLFNDTNINLSLFCENERFLGLFRQNIKELRAGLNKLGLVPANIQTYNATKDSKVRKAAKQFVYQEQTDMGVNIRV